MIYNVAVTVVANVEATTEAEAIKAIPGRPVPTLLGR